MDDNILFIQLRDCFYAGYTLPQFCSDNEIKKPLFVAPNANYLNELWSYYVQFSYDKRITAKFAIMKGNSPEPFRFTPSFMLAPLEVKNISEIEGNYDSFFMLTSQRLNIGKSKIIYLDELTNIFISRAYVDIPLEHFLQTHKDIKLIVVNYPTLHSNKYPTAFEKQLWEDLKTRKFFKIRDEIKNNPNKKISTPFDFLGYTNSEVYDLLETPTVKTNSDGSTSMQETENKLLGIKDGKRMTADQPERFKNKIYFVGNCVYFGIGVPFNKTLESYLQKELNKKNLPYRVENESQFFSCRTQDTFYNLNKLPLKSGDIVFLCLDDLVPEKVPFINVRNFFDRPHNYGEVFSEPGHINELGHKALAKHFFNILIQNNFFRDVEFKIPSPPPWIHRYGIPQENFSTSTNFSQNKELENYKKILRAKKIPVGAIVMNCNPFTLGHEYLIEYAMKKVKKLYVFVVEEDKSDFKFADRFKLVKEGVKKFSNVEVLPSGKFIISQQTFSGYFNKENLQDVAVDSSEDVEIFGREIAPTLGITVRFVGEEPVDKVTKSYNDTMKKILPQYGVEVCEIPRREINGEVISAKKVREALKVGDFDTIKKLVPKTTLKFLRDKFLK